MNPQETDKRTRPHILVIDDDPLVLRATEQFLRDVPVIVHSALNCAEGRGVLQTIPEIALVICDQLLPDGVGVDFLRDMLTQYSSAIRILMTGVQDRQIALDAINKGEIYRFMSKPIYKEDMVTVVIQALDKFNLMAENARLQSKLALQNEELRRANAQLSGRVEEERRKSVGFQSESASWKEAFQNMVDLVLEILQRIDLNLFKHSQRVAKLSTAIARELGKDQEFLDKVELAALLHDIGLLGASPFLQTNQRRLDQILVAQERDFVRSHPEVSASLIRFLPLPDVIQAVEMHHEYVDGSGYPKGAQGTHIPLLAAILCVADSFDESHGPYEFAISQIEVNAGKLYQAEIVRSLSRLLQQHTFEFAPEKPILVGELKPGMKLTSSIYTTAGMLLVKQGQILNEAIIYKLQQHDVANTVTQSIFVEG
ncbi:MAG: HD domain-containing phosphohydrolase [Verrucomicrobiota bacterium]